MNRDEKYLLVVSPSATHPQDAGNRKRLYSVLSFLKERGWAIHLVLYEVMKIRGSDLDGMRDCWDRVDVVRPDKWKRRWSQSRLAGWLNELRLGSGNRYSIDSWCDRNLVKHVQECAAGKEYAALIVGYVFLSQVLENVQGNILKVIDTNDVFGDRDKKMRHQGIDQVWFSTSVEEETKGLDRADVVLAIEESEAEYFRQRARTRVMHLGHLEDDHMLQREHEELRSIGIISSGNAINVRSVQLFLDALAKRCDLDAVEVRVAGSVCDSIRTDRKNVRLLGKVASLDEFYASADLYVNPMIAGTGLKIKSIEALSYGVPFISTEEGGKGICPDNAELKYASPEDLVQRISAIFQDKNELAVVKQASRTCFMKYRKRIKEEYVAFEHVLSHSAV